MRTFAVRRVAIIAVLAATVVVTGGCGARPSPGAGAPVILAAPAPAGRGADLPATPLTEPVSAAAVAEAALGVEPNTTLGAVVFDRVEGAVLLSVAADRRFRAASIVKLMIAVDVLRRGADDADRRDLTRMLSASDDDVASAHWVRGGGPEIIARVVPLLGLTGTAPPEQPGAWGEVTLTADDVVRVYRYVVDTLPPADRALVVDALRQAPPVAADGFDQHFGIPQGIDADWAVKQGWGNNSHSMAVHSTGLVGPGWRYVVVLLTEHPLGSGWRTSAHAVTAAATALGAQLPV